MNEPGSNVWRPGAHAILSVLAGAMLTTALPPQQGTGPLAVVAVAVMLHVLRGTPHPARHAFFFGLAHQAPLLVWLFYLDPAKSIPTRALVPVQAMAAILFVAAHYALFGLAVRLVRRWWGRRAALPLLPLLWFGLELLRSVGELGFPWCLVGAAWLDTPLQPLYAAAGEAGLGAGTVLMAASLVVVGDLVRTGVRPPAASLGLVVVTALFWTGLYVGSRPMPAPTARSVRVAAVQANVTQADKWDDAKIDSTRVPYTALTREAARRGAELVVWAETAVPAYLRYERDLYAWVRDLVQAEQVTLLAGFPDAQLVPGRLDAEGNRLYERYNSAGLFDQSGALLDTYAKHHLVPLGEAIPFQRWLPWLGEIDVGQAEWIPGPPPGPLPAPTAVGEVSLVVLICYEAIFSDLVRQAVRRGGAVLVNITNDGWFGHGAGPAQHAALARIRAVETGAPLVRSANNGISMITGPDGHLRDSLPLHRRGVVLADVPTAAQPTWYVRLGRWPTAAVLVAWSCCAVLLVRGRRDEEAA